MSEQREALAEALAEAFHLGLGMPKDAARESARIVQPMVARLLADAEQRGADRVAAAVEAVVKRACDIECKSPGTHRQCTSHEPYRALIGAALTTGAADRMRAEEGGDRG